jgi:outer membrane protein assembly factor BamD
MSWRIALSFLLVVLWGCSSSSKVDPKSAEGLYALGEKYEKDERFEDAIAQFSQVKNKFPYNTLATSAELKIADIQFKREEFVEAQGSYQTFKELHPSHPRSDYVTFQLGLSFFNQLPPTIDRDLSIAEKALLYFDEVITSFSASSFVKDAKEYREKTLRMQAEKELYIARFYFKRESYDSALGRFENLTQKFPQSDFAPAALKGAALSAFRLKDAAKANEILQRLETQFPNARETSEAKEELKNGG